VPWGLDVLRVDGEAAGCASGSGRTAPLPRGDGRFPFVYVGQIYAITILDAGNEDGASTIDA
jgi:hypothetical protein